jgi:hypothetical protein
MVPAPAVLAAFSQSNYTVVNHHCSNIAVTLQLLCLDTLITLLGHYFITTTITITITTQGPVS